MKLLTKTLEFMRKVPKRFKTIERDYFPLVLLFVFVFMALAWAVGFRHLQSNAYESTKEKYQQEISIKQKKIEKLRKDESELEDELYNELIDNRDNTSDRALRGDLFGNLPYPSEYEKNKRESFYTMRTIVSFVREFREDEKLYILCKSTESTITELNSEIKEYNNLIDEYKEHLLTVFDTGRSWDSNSVCNYIQDYTLYEYEN